MTSQRSFKRLVRSRMEKTGESYTAARAVLLAGEEEPQAAESWLATSDERIRERTGRGWEEWFDLLDDWGAAERPHREISRWVADQLGIGPLVREAQAVTSATSAPAACGPSARPSRASPSPPRGPWRCRWSACSTRSSTSPGA